MTQALNDATSYAYGQCLQKADGDYQQTDALSDDVLQVMCDVGCTALCVNSTGTTTTTTVQPSATFTLLGGQTISYGQTFTFAGSPYASGGDYTFYGTATTLSGPISAGTTSFIVASQAGFQIGDTILIGGEGSNGEIKTIVSFSSININSGLSTSHGTGSTVVQVFSSSGSSGGDPVALFGDVRREFWLPTGMLHPILHMPELNMMASTFPGDDGEQWFDRVIITSPGGFKIADVSIKKGIGTFNRSTASRDAFETLDVTLGMADSPMNHMPDLDFLFKRMGVYITFMRMDQMRRPIANQMRINGARRDVVMVACKSAHLLIAASPASEYSSFRPDLAVRYSHIDIIILEMHHRHALKGLLPELWGIKPLSNRTKSFLVPPKKEEDKDVEPSSDPSRFLANRAAPDLPDFSTSTDTEEDGKVVQRNLKDTSNEMESCVLADGPKRSACVL